MMDLKASWPWPKARTRVSPFEAAACMVKRTASGPVKLVSASYVKPAPHSIMSHLRACTEVLTLCSEGCPSPSILQACTEAVHRGVSLS